MRGFVFAQFVASFEGLVAKVAFVLALGGVDGHVVLQVVETWKGNINSTSFSFDC